MLLHLVSEKTPRSNTFLQCLVPKGCEVGNGIQPAGVILLKYQRVRHCTKTAVINYSISSLTHRKGGEKQPLTLCPLHQQHFRVSGYKKPHKAASKNLLFGKTGDKMASNGALKVNQYLQLEGYENIYVIGDCADLEEPKMAYHAGLHADVVVTNIINSLTQKPLKTYKPGKVSSQLLALGAGLLFCKEQLSNSLNSL